jgi:hypothetical protein
VADGWCWFVLREEYCWLVVGGWFVLREKYCWLVADKPSEHADLVKNLHIDAAEIIVGICCLLPLLAQKRPHGLIIIKSKGIDLDKPNQNKITCIFCACLFKL